MRALDYNAEALPRGVGMEDVQYLLLSQQDLDALPGVRDIDDKLAVLHLCRLQLAKALWVLKDEINPAVNVAGLIYALEELGIPEPLLRG
jgi:hypothetical protein